MLRCLKNDQRALRWCTIMNELGIEAFVAYLQAKPDEASSLTGCVVRHKSGASGKVVRAEIENGLCYLICSFSEDAFSSPKLSFDLDSLRDADVHLLSVPDDLFARYANWLKWYEPSLAREKAEASKRLDAVKSGGHVPLVLPERLQNFIAQEVGWNYSPKRDGYNVTEEVPLIDYMGTYFPRSFAEAYFFCAVMLQKAPIAETLLDRSSISIVDIGSGTGANILGVLWAIRDHRLLSGSRFPPIYTSSVDKSAEALEIQSRLIRTFFQHRVTIEPLLLDYTSGTEFLNDLTQRLSDNGPLDIIMCWKSICEFYRSEADCVRNRGMYAKLLKLADNYLKSSGFLGICDVTYRPYRDHKQYLPCIINREMHESLKTGKSELVPILPLSCAHWHRNCSDYAMCFFQKYFRVSHKALPEPQKFDRTGVFLKVFARKPFARLVLMSERIADEYVIGHNRKGDIITCRFGKKGNIPPEQQPLQNRPLVDAFQWAAGKQLPQC
jgi:hypothetical protein